MGDVLSCCLDRDESCRIRYITKKQFEKGGVHYFALKVEEEIEQHKHERIYKMIDFEVKKYYERPQNQKEKIPDEIDYLKKRLRNLGIGIETPVMCYDSSDGKRAARLACKLSYIGLQHVRILDHKTEVQKSQINVTNAKEGRGQNFDFAANKSYFVKEEDFSEIVKDGQSKTQIVDVRSIKVRDLGSIKNSKHIQITELFKDGRLIDKQKILSRLYWAGILQDQPVIFYGGLDAYVLKAITDHAGFTAKTQVFEMSHEEWIANNQDIKLSVKPPPKEEQVPSDENKKKEAPSNESKKDEAPSDETKK